METLSRRAEQNARNREALLGAARSVFLRAGFHATTVEAIASEAGFTTGAIYSRFDGKADLFLALLEERIEERAKQFAGLATNDGDARVEAARKWADIMRTELDWSLLVIEFRVHAARDERLNTRYAELHESSLRSLAENIATSLPPGTVRPKRIERLARAAMAASTGAALARAAEGDGFTDDLYEDIVLALTSYFSEENSA
jgi:AcrR family transcriptional regulator